MTMILRDSLEATYFQNTAYDTQKWIKLLTGWRSVRNTHFQENPVPDEE